VYNIASISLFILLSAQLPRTLNLIFENNLVSFEYFSFWQNWRYANLTLIFYYYFCLNFISFCACFVFFICINFDYFLCQELWLFYVHFFSSKIFNFTDVLFYYVLANRQFRYPTSLQFVTVVYVFLYMYTVWDKYS
jgi:hypothetical protein